MYIEPPDSILHTIKDSSADQEIEGHAQLFYPRIIQKRQQIKHLNKYTKIMVTSTLHIKLLIQVNIKSQKTDSLELN